MQPRIIGENLLARDDGGRLRTRIATVFPGDNVVVTLPGIHATQRLAHLDAKSEQRVAQGLAPLTEEELDCQCLRAVDLVLEDDTILIRPDPAEMKLAFEADELLQEIAPKEKIKFLHVKDPKVREAIKRRGECWRINSLPRSPEQMQHMISASRIGIDGREIYYYNNGTGTRFLTYQQFCDLAAMEEPELRRHLAEIRSYCTQANRGGNPEIAFFMANDPALPQAFVAHDFPAMDSAQLWAAYGIVRQHFHDAVRPEFRRDDPHSPQWRSVMYASLIGETDKAVSEEALLGLSAEFFMQVEWVPGGRMEEGELIIDPVYENGHALTPDGRPICDDKARGFIFNFVRDYGDLEHVNIGRVAGTLSSRTKSLGRRGVYLAELQQCGAEQPILRIIRMQKWGVREHLDDGKDLLGALLEAEQYTEYILDRRLGCRQVGMNLPARVTARKVGERYNGTNRRYEGLRIYSAYFERDYIPGLATDKVSPGRFADRAFSLGFARTLGRAAAPNIIVGRCGLDGTIIFDDGDELVIEGPDGVPVDIIVADPTGTFGDYLRDLRDSIPAYAACVNKRVAYLEDARLFAEQFVEGFVERLTQIQQEYRKRKRAFDTLFQHERRDEGGSFAYRWERVLDRLHRADPALLAERMRHCFRFG